MEDDELMDSDLIEAPPEWRVNAYDLVVVGATLVQGVAEAVVATAALTRQLFAGHANYVERQRTFHEEAALGIEEITDPDQE